MCGPGNKCTLCVTFTVSRSDEFIQEDKRVGVLE